MSAEFVAIIQARMGSTRLPNKVLSDIVGRPMLWHILNRVKKSEFIDDIILATTTDKKDDDIVEFAKEHGIIIFRGSNDDVLDRYYQAANENNVKNIVRITADDPLKDPDVIDKIIKIYKKNGLDYVSNTIEPTYPLGLDTEVFSFEALERAWNEADKKFEREHVTPYIWMNPDKFDILNVRYEGEDLSDLRWTVDTKEDLCFARAVYDKLFKDEKVFLMNDVLNLLEKYPEISRINDKVRGKNILN